MHVLKPYFKKYRQDVVGALIFALLSAFASLYQPRLLENIQKALLADQQGLIRQDAIWIVLMGVISIIAGVLNVFYAARLAKNVTSDLREDTYKQIQKFSYQNVEQFSTGSLTTRLINDMNQVLNMVMMTFMQLVRLPIMTIGAFVFCIVIIPRYWWASVLMVVLLVGVGLLVMQRMTKLFDLFQAKMDQISTQAKETLQGVRVVKSFNQGDQEIKKFNQTSDTLNGYNLEIGYWFSSIMPAFQFVAYAIITLVVYLIGTSITAHPQDVTVISPYVNYVLTLLYALMMFGMVMTTFSRGNVSLGRIEEVLTTQPAVVFNDQASTDPLGGNVEFDDVSFTYPGSDQQTLKHISFNIDAGKMVGIVGATGSGKSTLAQLIARIYDPTSGTVKIGGHDLKEVNETALRKTVAFVLQKAVLFSGTISSNLRQGKKHASEYELERAADMAQATEFIQHYSDRFEHEVEERSANFSGGQKQRLSIARGLIAKSPILILDDSMSALDAESEKLVQTALEHELADTTTFIIAEKIVSVMHADTILVLDDGKLVAQGTHEELLKTSPVYQSIYQTQKAKERKEV